MPVRTPQTPPLRELDHRHSDGLDVTLFWDEEHERLQVCVSDARSGEYFVLLADYAEALEAFHHPYGYAAREQDRGSVALRAPRSSPSARHREE
jgi:hypothetical protein